MFIPHGVEERVDSLSMRITIRVMFNFGHGLPVIGKGALLQYKYEIACYAKFQIGREYGG